MAVDKVIIHYIIADEDGPIKSGGEVIGSGPTAHRIGGGRYAHACGHNGHDQVHRGSDCPWAVTCEACKATKRFKKDDRPRPGRSVESAKAVTATTATSTSA